MFENIYQNKKVLVTGHTGFKGAWLTSWLLKLGANVVGFSKDIPTKPSMYNELGLEDKITHYLKDTRDLNEIQEVISNEVPDFVFHLAAQPIVSLSYSDPIETISSNVMGTANVLEALRLSNHKCTAIIITSDKAYDNIEQIWASNLYILPFIPSLHTIYNNPIFSPISTTYYITCSTNS